MIPKLAEEQRRKGWAITNVKRVTFEAIHLNGKDVTDAFRRAVSKNEFAQ